MRTLTETRAVIKHNVTPMRRAPRAGAEQVSQAIFGETVRPAGREGEYTEIQSPDAYGGWVLTRHIALLETGERYPDPARAALVTPLFLPVFRKASTQSERMTLLTLGTVVELADGPPDAELYPIRTPGGGTGYVESGALIVPEYPEMENLGPNLALVARAFVGVPYLWGGRTTFGIDCSGFVQRVFWLSGHVIPRDAELQAFFHTFDEVEREDITIGDLVFFYDPDLPGDRIVTHVGIALPEGRFIHASGKHGVAITPLSQAPYAAQFWGARRLVRDRLLTGGP